MGIVQFHCVVQSPSKSCSGFRGVRLMKKPQPKISNCRITYWALVEMLLEHERFRWCLWVNCHQVFQNFRLFRVWVSKKTLKLHQVFQIFAILGFECKKNSQITPSFLNFRHFRVWVQKKNSQITPSFSNFRHFRVWVQKKTLKLHQVFQIFAILGFECKKKLSNYTKFFKFSPF